MREVLRLHLGAALRLPLRQTKGFVRSLREVMQLDLAMPDHATPARRRTVDVHDDRWPRKGPIDIVIDSTGLRDFGAGEWARAKHGETRRSWRKLHLSVNPDDSKIIAHELTGDDTSDAAMNGDLTANFGGNIRSVIADGACDGATFYQAIFDAGPRRSPQKIVIAPATRSTTRINRTATVSAKVMPQRLRPVAERLGRSTTDTASAYWSRRPSPSSNASMAGASPPEPSAPSRTGWPFTSRLPTPTTLARPVSIRVRRSSDKA